MIAPERQAIRRAAIWSIAVPFAAIFLLLPIWHLALAGSSGSRGRAIFVLTGIALVAGVASIVASRRRDSGRGPWFCFGFACFVLAAGLPFQLDPDAGAVLAFDLGFAAFVPLIATGLLLAIRLSEHEGYRKLALDLVAPVVAVVVVLWLAMSGPYVIDGNAERYLRITAAVHGAGTAILLVAVVAGLAVGVRGAPDLPRLVLASFGLVAAGDMIWLIDLADRSTSAAPNPAVFAGFASGLVLLTVAALRPGSQRATPAARTDFSELWPGLPLLPYLSLGVLLTATLAQSITGDVIPHGAQTSTAGALVVVAFVMVRQILTHHHERRLQRQIGQLNLQIDGLISQVGRDPLTGLLNHRSVHARLDQELIHARAERIPLSVVLIDVDNFKTVNDKLGHPAGDRVLRAVAQVLVAACRATDIAARYAGDEFMLVLPGAHEEQTRQACERIAREIRLVSSSLGLGAIGVTLSIGAAVTPGTRRTATQLVAIADAAMYDAKEAGKDRIVVVDADTLLTPTVAPVRDLLVPTPMNAYRVETFDRRTPDRAAQTS